MTAATLPRLVPRWRHGVRADLPVMARIDAAGYCPGYSEDRLAREIRLLHRCAAVVTNEHGPVVGYCLHELASWRIVVHRLAVAPEFRRRGVGRLLLDRLAGQLRPEHRTRVLVPADAGGLPGQLFLRACDFICYATERAGGGETYLFARDLPGRAGRGE